MSAMGEMMASQPALLRELLADDAPCQAAADRIRGRRILLVGTGTSWHAANQGAWLLRAAGAEAWAVQAVDAAEHGPRPAAGDALLLLSHRGTKRYTNTVLERARAEGTETVVISGRGAPGADIETSEPERSAAFTGSHLGALMRVAQIAVALGADLGRVEQVPDVVAAVLDAPGPGYRENPHFTVRSAIPSASQSRPALSMLQATTIADREMQSRGFAEDYMLRTVTFVRAPRIGDSVYVAIISPLGSTHDGMHREFRIDMRGGVLFHEEDTNQR